ncbi:MAG: hypothetical protein ACSLEM_04680 [Candidatus Malihini olakiniferum]
MEKDIGRHDSIKSLKVAIGHTLAAAGALEIVMTIFLNTGPFHQ